LSAPRLLWPIAGHPFQGRGMRAACIHDWLYDKQSIHNYTRRQCDKIFYRELLSANRCYYQLYPNNWIIRKIANCRAFVKYFAVRVFGFLFYKK